MSRPDFLTLVSTRSRTHMLRNLLIKFERQRNPASVGVALAALSFAIPDPATRSSADVVVCDLLRLATTYLHDLVHRRPGQGSREGASHSKGVHREIVWQACFPQINGRAGERSFGSRKGAENPGYPPT